MAAMFHSTALLTRTNNLTHTHTSSTADDWLLAWTNKQTVYVCLSIALISTQQGAMAQGAGLIIKRLPVRLPHRAWFCQNLLKFSMEWNMLDSDPLTLWPSDCIQQFIFVWIGGGCANCLAYPRQTLLKVHFWHQIRRFQHIGLF
jgi:hypothetical protein